MRCFVTGASGHLGAHLVRELLRAGHVTAVLVRDPSTTWRLADSISALEVIQGDLRTMAQSAAQIRRFEPDAVFHLAWEGRDASARHSDVHTETNLPASIALAEIAKASGASVFVGVGSQAEYGRADTRITEETPTHPTSSYARAKLSASAAIQQLASGSNMRSVWLRLFSIYGPREDGRHLVPYVIGQFLERRRPRLTACEQLWDYLYVDDAVRALVAAADANSDSGIFNLASGNSVVLRSVVEHLRTMIAPDIEAEYGVIPYSPNGPMRLDADVSRFQRATGWQPMVPLHEGLSRTVDWYRAELQGTL